MAKNSIESIVDKWRGMIKGRKRVIISLEEIMEQKIRSLRPWIFRDTEPLEGWTYRQFIYSGKNPRRWIDDDWRPIGVGDTWGGENVSALFKCHAKMPKRFRGRKVALRVYFQGDGLLRVNGRPYHGLRGTTIVSDGQWHHVAQTVAQGGDLRTPATRLYVDGREDMIMAGTGSDNLWNTTADADVGIGVRSSNGDRFFTGLIDGVRIYDRALSPGEVAGLAGLTVPFDKSF